MRQHLRIIQQIDQNPYEHIFVAHYEDPVFYVEVNTHPLFFRNPALLLADASKIGRASCRERV